MTATTKAIKNLNTSREPEWKRLTTGIEARIVPVGASLIDDVTASIKDPKVPTFFDEDKEREEENPLHPDYLEALEATERRRAIAAMETLLLFGLELKEVPPQEKWLPKLKFLEKRGHISLTEYDFDDPMDSELAYKKYIAVGTMDLIRIGQQAGLNAADVEAAARTFQDNS